MANTRLAPVYQDVYGEKFTSDDFSKRMKMQKLIYLLQEAGISIGDYNFHWSNHGPYKRGPYSQRLQNDILKITNNDNRYISYSESARIAINRLKHILDSNPLCDDTIWIDCLSSLQYLKNYVCSYNASDKEIVEKLQERKPHLNNKSANMFALSELKLLYN